MNTLTTLKQKLDHPQASYKTDELNFLMNNIGNPNSEIRDDLVCSIFGKAFLNDEFTFEQARFCYETAIKQNLLFYRLEETGSATLTRSFTCLLYYLIIHTSNDSHSSYYHLLTSQEEIELYNLLIKYLKTEHDFTASTPEYGWVDAIPHCSDALSEAIKQNNFSSQLIKDLFQATDELLKNIDRNLDHNELSRLAAIYINGFENKKITKQQFILWNKILANFKSKNSQLTKNDQPNASHFYLSLLI